MTTTNTEILAERQWERVLDDGTFLVANAKLIHLAGNERPYFSLTGEHWQSKRHHDRGWESGASFGQIHERLVAEWPELAPLAAIHLSGDDGAPMYDVANGWYWYRTGELHSCAEHLRVSFDDLPALPTEEAFAEYVDTLRDQWEREAADALALIEAAS